MTSLRLALVLIVLVLMTTLVLVLTLVIVLVLMLITLTILLLVPCCRVCVGIFQGVLCSAPDKGGVHWVSKQTVLRLDTKSKKRETRYVCLLTVVVVHSQYLSCC